MSLFAEDYELAEESSKTWRLNLESGCIEGETDVLEAVAQSALMALMTPRYRHLIFPWQYGSELATLIGKPRGYAVSEAKRMISDALCTDTRITSVRDFSYEAGTLFFTMDTIYGSKRLGTEVQSG